MVRCPDGQVKVMSKGADTTMVPLLREDTSQVPFLHPRNLLSSFI